MVTLNKEGLIMTAKTPRHKIPAPPQENIQVESVAEPIQVPQPAAITAYDKFWDDLPSYIVEPIINGDPNATLTSDLTVSNALKLKFECQGSYVTEICLHVGKTAMNSGIYMEVESTHINDKSEYRVHAKFDCVTLNNAPNANSLYNYLMANISKVAR
jgi:hypothetical protein